MNSVRLFAGGALVGSVLTATGFVLVQEQTRLAKEDHKSNDRLFKYGVPQTNISVHSYKGHSLAYDNAKHIPLWVAELLTRDTLYHSKGADRHQSHFKVDPSVPAEYQATNSDYLDSGWSRGHMAAAANHVQDQQEMNETFYLTNVVPQLLNNNIGYWSRLELYCRDLAACHKEVRVFTGPLFLPHEKGKNDKKYVHYEVIGRNRVAVPTHLYKVIVADDGNGEPHLGVFVIPNESITGDKSLQQYQVSLGELEKYLGMKLTPQLDQKMCNDLCAADGCKMMSLQKFESIRYTQRLRSSHDLETLESVWREMRQNGHHPDTYTTKQYAQRKEQLLNTRNTNV